MRARWARPPDPGGATAGPGAGWSRPGPGSTHAPSHHRGVTLTGPAQGPGPPETDDPTGGRPLTRRLARILPLALVAGLVVGVPLAFLAGDWRPAVMVPAALMAVAGTIAAAVEDGRVQRRVEGRRRATRPRD